MIIWIKRAAVLLAALILGFALILTAALLLLDEADYKRLLSWGAEQFLDSQLIIEGPLYIDISRNLSLNSGGILLKANDDSYRLAVGDLRTSFRLGSYLTTGTFWFNNLQLTDVHLEVQETASGGHDPDTLRIPPVVVEQAQVHNLVLDYQELQPGTLHTFALTELTLGKLGEQQPVSLRATGLFEGQPFVLQGTSASIAQMLESREPHPVQLELSNALINARLQGTIADPVNGRGLDLQIQTDVAQVSDILEIFRNDIPPLGSLKGTLALRGDYTAPRLEDIDLHLQRGEEVDLTVTGSVADALSGAGLDLQLDGHSDNPVVLSWLLIHKHDRMQAIRGSGRLQGDIPLISLHDLDAAAETADGLKLELKGSAVVHPAGYKLTQADAGLAVAFSTPTLAAANLTGLEGVPKLGPASGSLSLALAMDAIAIYKVDISIGSRNDSLIIFKGDGGYLQLTDVPELSGINLQTDIQTTDLARLGKQLGYELPALGPARVRGKVVSRGPELMLQDARLDIGTQEQATLHATGMLGTQMRDPSRFKVAMDVDIQAAELTRLGEPFGFTLPQLGQTRLTGRLESSKSDLQFRDARIEVGAADQPTIRANGKVTTQLQKGSTINVTFDVAVADLIAAFRDKLTGYLGRVEGHAVISDLDGQWGIEQFNLATTQTSLYQLNLDGRYDDLVKYDQASINASLVVDNPEKLGEALDLNLTGVGAYKMQGLLSIDKGRLNYQGKATLGSTSSTTGINGQLINGRPVFSGSFDIPVLQLADFGVGSSGKHIASEPAQGKPDSPYVFSREPLNIEILNDFDLDLTVSIDKVQSDELAIDRATGKLRLRDGHLTVAPLRLVFEGGNTDINLDIKAAAVPEYRLAIVADDVTLGPLMAQVQDDVPIHGYSNMHLDLQARGHSPHELASNLSGTASLGLENARIPNRYVEMLSVDVLGWVVSKSVSRKKHTNLNCVVMAFDITTGEVKSNTLIADGPNLSMGGKIDMDLGEETLDIVLIPDQKKRFFSSISPVHVKGPMKDPNIEAVPVKAALKEVGTMALLPGVFIPIRAVERLWGLLDDGDKVGDGCANIDKMREAAKDKVPGQDAASNKTSGEEQPVKKAPEPDFSW